MSGRRSSVRLRPSSGLEQRLSEFVSPEVVPHPSFLRRRHTNERAPTVALRPVTLDQCRLGGPDRRVRRETFTSSLVVNRCARPRSGESATWNVTSASPSTSGRRGWWSSTPSVVGHRPVLSSARVYWVYFRPCGRRCTPETLAATVHACCGLIVVYPQETEEENSLHLLGVAGACQRRSRLVRRWWLTGQSAEELVRTGANLRGPGHLHRVLSLG